ncbi:MAG: type II secretion system F family protein [Pirellulales bacterium]
MATFQYQATDATGNRVKGLVSADNARAARDELRRQGLRIRQLNERSQATKEVTLAGSLRRRKYHSALTEFYREWTTLLQASVPLLDALDSCLAQLPAGLTPAISSLRDRVSQGASVAEAMELEPWLFDEMTVGMVRVGETAGNLDEVLDQVATFREQSSQMQDRVLSAIIYPAIVLCVSIAVTVFLMTVVVPMLLDNLTELGRELPWPTQLLKWMSHLMLNHGWWLGLLGTAAAIGLLVWSRRPSGKLLVGKIGLRIPVLGNLIRKQTIGRSVLVIACLLRSGIELVQAIRIAGKSCNHPIFREALQSVANDIEKGQGLRESIVRQTVFPASIAQVFSLGQQSGQLESMLQRLGRDYERQCSVLSGRLTTIAEPILIVMLSVIVGFIMFATVMPIMEAGNMLGK